MRLTEKLILGTAQLGMSYGINNHNGKPSRAEAFEILKLAQDNGILFLDTAPGYGESQRVIGAYHSEYPGFEVITKFAVNQPFILTKEVEQSFQQLNIESIHCLMYHRFNDCFDQDIRNSLIELKHSGKIQKIGISVYGNDQFEEAISLTHVDVIQIPFNVLDNRNQRGQLMMKAKKNGKEIHVRSVFLQGLFFMSPNRMPESLKPLAGYLNQLNTIATGANSNLASIALLYALQNPHVDRVLIGVETASQLRENMQRLSARIDPGIWSQIDQIHVSEVDLLSPVNWKLNIR